MEEQCDVVVIGAGQAGLSLSHELSGAGVEHLVLERGKVGQSWRGRWDSFCLVLPNWTVRLPGGEYRGGDPDGFMPRDDIVAHLVGYATGFKAPLRQGITVTSVEPGGNGDLLVRSASGDIRAKDVVFASGGYQKAHRPPGADQLPPGLYVIDAEAYRTPGALPPGAVLVIGSGQTGCQLAEELSEARRTVHLACGRAPWVPRQIEGRDTISWLVETSFFEEPVANLPSPSARLLANPQISGRSGGHDLNYRTLQAMGVTLVGHFQGADNAVVHFAPDVADSVAFGDARHEAIGNLIRQSCVERGTRVPEVPPPPAFVANAPTSVDLASFGSVIFTSGFRPDYARWVRFPGAFDEMGFPVQQDGSSTVVPGLHFMGVHFQRKRKSATLLGVGEDAVVLAEKIATRA